MKKTTRLLLPLLLAASLPAFAQNAATVNGKPIPTSHVNTIVSEVVQQGQTDSPELRKTVTENLIMREVLVQEADKKKLGTLPAVKTQMDIMRKNILVRALMSDFVQKNPVSDADVQKEYDRLKASAGKTEYQTQHILVKSEEEAKAIIEQLGSGENFDELAKAKSIDTPTATKGGDLGWSAPNVYVDPFAEALVKLQKGEFTKTAVQSSYGYHIIKLKDTRPLVFPSRDELKAGLTQELQGRKWNQYTQDLRQKAKVK